MFPFFNQGPKSSQQLSDDDELLADGLDPEFDQLLTNAECYHSVLISLKDDVEKFLSSCQEATNRMNKIADSLVSGLAFDAGALAAARAFAGRARGLREWHLPALDRGLREAVLRPLEGALVLGARVAVHAEQRAGLLRAYRGARREAARAPAGSKKRARAAAAMGGAWEALLAFNQAAVRQLYEQVGARQAVLRGGLSALADRPGTFFAHAAAVCQGTGEEYTPVDPTFETVEPPASPPLPPTAAPPEEDGGGGPPLLLRRGEEGGGGARARGEGGAGTEAPAAAGGRGGGAGAGAKAEEEGAASSATTTEEELAAAAVAVVEKIATDDCVLVALAMATAEVQASEDLAAAAGKNKNKKEGGRGNKKLAAAGPPSSSSSSGGRRSLPARFVSLFSSPAAGQQLRLPQPRTSATPSRRRGGDAGGRRGSAEAAPLVGAAAGAAADDGDPAERSLPGTTDWNGTDGAMRDAAGAPAAPSSAAAAAAAAGPAAAVAAGLWPLACGAAYLRLPDLARAAAVCARWRDGLRDRPVYWCACVRSGGVPGALRGRFWFLLVQGKMPWQKGGGGGGGSSGSNGPKRAIFEKGLYRNLVQRAFHIIQQEKELEAAEYAQQAAGAERGTQASSTRVANGFSLQWFREMEQDLARTYPSPTCPSRSSSHHNNDEEEEDNHQQQQQRKKKGGEGQQNSKEEDGSMGQDGWQAWQSHGGKSFASPGKHQSARHQFHSSQTNAQGKDLSQLARGDDAGHDNGDFTIEIAKLQRVLCAFAMYHQRVAYCQGMNFVAARLLEACGGEEEPAFWVLVGVAQQFAMGEVWSPGLRRLNFCFFALGRLLRDRAPALHAHFQAEEVAVGMFAARWFVTLFAGGRALGPRAQLRLWDAFLVEKWAVVFQTALALLQHFEARLLTLDFEGILHLLRTPLAHLLPPAATAGGEGGAAGADGVQEEEEGSHTAKGNGGSHAASTTGGDPSEAVVVAALGRPIDQRQLVELEAEYHLNDF